MIKTVRGDLITAKVEALVNPVNCVGIMGTGLALQFKKKFPDNFLIYQAACASKELYIGKVLTTETKRVKGPRYVINFPTKHHWVDYSRLEDIEAGLISLVREVANKRIKSIAIPMLGCGMGKLDWRQVRPRIEYAFERLPTVEVHVYAPQQR